MINPSPLVEAMSQKKQFIWEIRTAVLDIIALDFDVSPKSDFQFRINDSIDLYIMKRRYHDIRNNQRGEYPESAKDLVAFLSRRLNAKVDLKLYQGL